MMWLQVERGIVARQRFVVSLQLTQRIAAVAERIGMIRPQRDRTVVISERIVEMLQLKLGDAAIDQRLDEVGPQETPRRNSSARRLAALAPARLCRDC